MNNDVTQMAGQGQQQEEEVVINLADISTLLQIIDVVSQRGGFQGQEMAGVGTLRNKLETFLRQKGPKQPQGDGEQSASVDTADAGELANKVIS